LPGIAVLQPSRAIAKHRLAARALDLDETHAPTINNDWKSAAKVSRTSEESLKAGCGFSRMSCTHVWQRNRQQPAIVSRPSRSGSD
jgi:hypothetical protein